MAAAQRMLSIALVSLIWAALGCGTDAVGVDACRKIEGARCARAPACGITLEPPYSTNGGDVNECIRFYDDACLHGLESGTAPSPTQLNACLAAINGMGPTGNDCSVVASPAGAAGCSWLATVPAADDASVNDADAGE